MSVEFITDVLLIALCCYDLITNSFFGVRAHCHISWNQVLLMNLTRSHVVLFHPKSITAASHCLSANNGLDTYKIVEVDSSELHDLTDVKEINSSPLSLAERRRELFV